MTPTDNTAKLSELTRVAKANAAKFVIPDSDKVFQFKCNGLIGGDSQLAGKRVEWKAKFERPLEELIYPSLQRFDLAGYERKQRYRQKMLDEHHGSAKTPSNIKYYNNHEPEHQIKLDPIPANLLPTNEDIMYVHTPQWTVKVTDYQRPRSRSGPKEIPAEDASSVSSEMGEYLNIGEELDVEGEKYLRERMRASIIEREEEKKRKEKIAMGFLLGLNRRAAVDLQPVTLNPLETANVLVRRRLL
jgi:hypothetical protein